MTHDIDDTTQRRLEQQALRNVRGLVDKLEADERRDRVGIRELAIAFAVVVAVVALGLFTWRFFHERAAPRPVVIEQPKKVQEPK